MPLLTMRHHLVQRPDDIIMNASVIWLDVLGYMPYDKHMFYNL